MNDVFGLICNSENKKEGWINNGWVEVQLDLTPQKGWDTLFDFVAGLPTSSSRKSRRSEVVVTIHEEQVTGKRQRIPTASLALPTPATTLSHSKGRRSLKVSKPKVVVKQPPVKQRSEKFKAEKTKPSQEEKGTRAQKRSRSGTDEVKHSDTDQVEPHSQVQSKPRELVPAQAFPAPALHVPIAMNAVVMEHSRAIIGQMQSILSMSLGIGIAPPQPSSDPKSEK